MVEEQIYGNKVVREFELTPQNRKSFYGKCRVLVTENGGEYLKSYSTIVAQVVDNVLKVFDWHSQTTTRHIWAFVDFKGCMCRDKHELEEGVKL